MKKNIITFVSILLLYLSVDNEEGVKITSLELLATGFDNSLGSMNFYNYLLNIATMVIYISLIQSAISSKFRLRDYISTRGGYRKFAICLIKTVLQHILLILSIKQFVYILFYFLSGSFTQFYVYDMISTLLTLSFLALILVVTKLKGISEKITLFSLLSFTIIAQYMSYNYPIFSAIVIASEGWQKMQSMMIVFKSVGNIVMVCTVLFLSNPGKVMEVGKK